MRRGILFFLTGLALCGCSSYGPEELDRLAKEDPQFRQMILARDQAHRQMRLIKDELLAKKQLLDAQVGRLRRDYDAYAKVQNLKAEKHRATIDANRELLRRQMETLDARLGSKSAELAGHEKTLEDVKKVLKESKAVNLSLSEKQKWEERMLMLSEKIRPLQDEIQELKLQIRLKKQKIGFLT